MNEQSVFELLSRVKFQRIILVTLVALVYGVSLLNGFVWDDRVFFIGNSVYKNFDLPAIFSSLANGVEYLPIRDITYAIDYFVWGENPFGFHLTNLLFFAGNILLVHRLAEMVTERFAAISGRTASWFVPFAVAVGFALHPINAEVVNFITCRNVLVSGLFVFIAVICIIRHMENDSHSSCLWYSVALLAFIAALLGKATAIMLPFLLVVTLPQLFPGQLKRISVLSAPFFLLAAVFFWLFKLIADKSGLTGTPMPALAVSGLERTFAQAIQIPLFYLKKLLLPVGFSVEYVAGFVVQILSVQVIFSLAVLTLIAVAAILLRRKFPWFLFGATWFGAALLPVLNFFATHPVVADRYAYLPTFGFVFIAASALDRLRHERVKLLFFFVIVVFMSGMTAVRSLDWRSEETLWRANIRIFPEESKGYINLAAFYFNNNQQQKALSLLADNINVPWLSVYLDYYEGRRLFALNDFAGSKTRFQKALDVQNGFVGVLHYLGVVAEKEGDYVSAAQYYNRALVTEEKDSFHERPLIRTRLEVLKAAWLDQYLAGMKEQLFKNPSDMGVRKEMAMTLDRLGFYGESLAQYLILERAGIHGWQIYHNIANCYFNMNSREDALNYYEKAISLGGGSEDTFNNLGIVYRKLSRFEESVQVLERAVTLFPAAAYPQFNLGVTYYDAGDKVKAEAIFAKIKDNFPDYKDRVAPYLKK